MGFLHKDLTYKIKGCIYDVHNALGVGLDEESYHKALEHRLRKSSLQFQSKVIKYVEHRGVKVHKFILDIIIEDKVILELKHFQGAFHPANLLQILGYLKCWEKDLGMLINFGHYRINSKRVAYTKKALGLTEDYTEINHLITSINRPYLAALRKAIIVLAEIHNTGYRHTIYHELLEIELAHNKIPFVSKTTIPIVYETQTIRHFNLTLPVIATDILCKIIVLKDNLTSDIQSMKTYLKNSTIKIGIIAHFGKEKLEIIGVCP